MRDLWKSIGFTSGARIYSLAAGAIGLVITARALGPDGRGAVAASTTWALLFATFGYLSLGQVALHRGSGRPPEEWLGSTLATLMAMAGIVTAAGWVVAAAIYAISGGDAYGDVPGYALVLGFAMLPLLVWELYGSFLLMAVGKISVYNRAEVVGRTVGIALIVVLVAVAGFGVAGALVALIIAQAVVAAGGIRYLLRRAGASLAFSGALLRELIAGGLKLHLTAIGSFLFVGASVLIVQSIKGPTDTGLFQVAAELTLVALIVPQAASMVIYGEIGRLGADGAWRSRRRVLVALVPGMVVLATVFALLAPAVVPFLLGHDFKPAVPVFQLLAFGLVGQAIGIVMAPQWVGHGLFWQASLVTLSLGICNVIACFPLVHAYGIKGAAYSLLGVSVLGLAANGVMALWVQRRASRTLQPSGSA